MPARHRILIGAVVVAFLAYVGFGVISPDWSFADVVAAAVFSLFFVLIVFLALSSKVSDPVDGYRGFPRSVWVLFASVGAAFALVLLAVAIAPWLGFEESGPLHDRWWVLPVLAAVMYPLVNRKLR